MSVLSYQSRSENWGDFLSGRCYSLESNVTVTHYHMVKKNLSTPSLQTVLNDFNQL